MRYLRPHLSRRGLTALKLGSGLGALAIAAGAATSTLHAQGAPADGESRLPPGPGRAMFMQGCRGCHAIGTSIGKRHTAQEWGSVIESMIGRGALIDADQAVAIRDYLAANFGPVAGGGTPVRAVAAAPPPGDVRKTFPRPSGPSQWPAYGGGNAQLNFSPLTQITPRNVKNLKQAWVYRYGAGMVPEGDQGLDYRFEVTPLLIGGVMYISTPASPAKPDLKASVTALRPETGEVIWKYESPLNIHGRGLAYWPGDEKTAPRLIFATDSGMISAVDVTTGRLAPSFGWGGQVDAYVGVVDEIVGETRRSTYTVPNPVSIYKDLIITASRPGEVGPPGPRGDIRAFDARTGRLVWDFHTIPQPGDANHDTWTGDQWRDLTGANVWSTMSVDDQDGIIYAATGDANAPLGVEGQHLYADTLLAIDARTGKLKWHHQITHHDIWDWDSPTPVVLTDVHQDGKTIPAVILTGKIGLLFMFDRRTGEPLNGFNEKPIPQPAKPDPEVPATQPFPDAPGPLARTQMTRDEIPDLAPGMKATCQKVWDDNHTVSAPLYAPRRAPDHAVITYPSSVGGPNWGGGSFIPDQHLYIVNLQNRVSFSLPVAGVAMNMHAAPLPPGVDGAGAPRGGPPRGGRPANPFSFTTPQGVNLSCGALPWSELVAVDVDTKKIVWRSPLGMTEGIGPKGETTGTSSLGGNVATQSGLVFVGATNDRRFRAFDAKTGRKLWETTLEASGAATPVTYMGKDGKQYVVLAAGGGTAIGQKQMSDTLVAYALP